MEWLDLMVLHSVSCCVLWVCLGLVVDLSGLTVVLFVGVLLLVLWVSVFGCLICVCLDVWVVVVVLFKFLVIVFGVRAVSLVYLF